MIDNNPTSASVRAMIKKFQKVLPMTRKENASLDMNNPWVNSRIETHDYECGTTHCHGGWYAIASCDLSKRIDFRTGGDQMAMDLGFSDINALQRWAMNNRDVWGNDYGHNIFSHKRAFTNPTCRPDGAENVDEILAHWGEVADRLEKLEKGKK